MLSPDVAELMIFIGGIVLNIFSIPTVLDSDAAVPRIQAIAYVVALSTVCIGYMSLGLFFPMLSVSFGVFIWIFILLYRPTDSAYLGIEGILPD
jgi:hypothetical protein